MENRIRELRKARNMTMKQLGAIFGIAESTISQYETGKRQPDNETLLRLGEFFNVSVDYLLGRDETASTPSGERCLTDGELMAAFFHGADPNLSEEDMAGMWQDAKIFRDFIVEKWSREKNGQ